MCLQTGGCIRGVDCFALFSRSGPVPQGDHAVLPHGRATPLMRITAICLGNVLQGHSITFMDCGLSRRVRGCRRGEVYAHQKADRSRSDVFRDISHMLLLPVAHDTFPSNGSVIAYLDLTTLIIVNSS